MSLEDLGPFVCGVVDAEHVTVRTDGFQPYRGLPRLGIRHDRRVQGLDPEASSRILPWVHRVFGNLKTWLRGTSENGFHEDAPLGEPDELMPRLGRFKREHRIERVTFVYIPYIHNSVSDLMRLECNEGYH